jgi:hypothetical protein
MIISEILQERNKIVGREVKNRSKQQRSEPFIEDTDFSGSVIGVA